MNIWVVVGVMFVAVVVVGAKMLRRAIANIEIDPEPNNSIKIQKKHYRLPIFNVIVIMMRQTNPWYHKCIKIFTVTTANH